MTRVIDRLWQRWQQAAQQNSAVDVQKDLMRLTADVTTNLAFGYDMNTLEKTGDVLQNHLEQVFPAIGRRLNTPFPYWRYVKLPADCALDRALAEIHQIIRGFISKARQHLVEQPNLREQPTNFLEAMLATEGTVLEGKEIKCFSDEEIVGNVFTMLLGGEDTTASTLSWMLYYLARSREIRARLQDEADVVLGDQRLPIDLAALERLQLTEAVAHETMRLRPVSPIMGLETQEDVVVAGIQIPKATPVFLLIRPGVLAEANFGQAHEFQPDRWLAPTGCPFHGAHNRSVHIPFGNGPRLCPGRSLALLEIKATMAMICRNFTVTPACDLNQVRELWGFTMMAAGLHLRFTPRAT
jgi:cytochrome P450